MFFLYIDNQYFTNETSADIIHFSQKNVLRCGKDLLLRILIFIPVEAIFHTKNYGREMIWR